MFQLYKIHIGKRKVVNKIKNKDSPSIPNKQSRFNQFKKKGK